MSIIEHYYNGLSTTVCYVDCKYICGRFVNALNSWCYSASFHKVGWDDRVVYVVKNSPLGRIPSDEDFEKLETKCLKCGLHNKQKGSCR